MSNQRYSPEFKDEAVVFIDCPDDLIAPTVLRLYDQDQSATQILCATKSCRFAGVEAINRMAHQKYAQHDQQLLCVNPESGALEQTGLCVDDLVVYLANDWSRDLQNGSLGRITESFPEPLKVNLGSDNEPVMREALGASVFEGAIARETTFKLTCLEWSVHNLRSGSIAADINKSVGAKRYFSNR